MFGLYKYWGSRRGWRKIDSILNRQANESYDDYFVRLFENRLTYKLSFEQVAELLNIEKKQNYGECAYRKEYASFNRGRIYEREKYYKGVATRILSISDLHIPFQLPVETFKDYIGRVDILQINGDITDCQAISKFPKLYRVSSMEELIHGRQYLIDLIEYIKPKEVIINKGNHDERFQKYLAKNLDTDILELLPETSLDLIVDDGFRHYDKRSKAKTFYEPIGKLYTDIKITYTGDWKCKIGRAWFCHPNAAKGQTLKTCEAAVDYLHKIDREVFDTVIMAHTHRLASSKQGFINLYEQGACCKTSDMNYTDGNLTAPQKEGLIYICQDKDGNILEDKTKLVVLN